MALWVAALVPDVMRRGRGLLLGGTLLAGAALGILAAGAATVTRDWWEPLGRSTVWTGYYLLRALGADAGVDPEHFLVGTPSFVVEITPYCSGYQGIGLMWVFLAAYLWLFRERLRFPRAFWLLPIGTLLVWLLNAVRIAVLVLIGSAGHEDVAMGGFHYHAGTLLFCATALGIGTWAASSRTFGTVQRARSEPGENPTAAYVLPLLALLATSLVTGAFSAAADSIRSTPSASSPRRASCGSCAPGSRQQAGVRPGSEPPSASPGSPSGSRSPRPRRRRRFPRSRHLPARRGSSRDSRARW